MDKEEGTKELDHIVSKIADAQKQSLRACNVEPEADDEIKADSAEFESPKLESIPLGRPPLAPDFSLTSPRFSHSTVATSKPVKKKQSVSAVESFSGGFFSSVGANSNGSAILIDDTESAGSRVEYSNSDHELANEPACEFSSSKLSRFNKNASSDD